MPSTRTAHRPAAPRRARRRLLRGVLTVVAVLAIASIGSGAAWAWWTASAPASAVASAAAVAPPTNVTCTTDSRLFYEDTATIRWAAPATPAPAGATRTYVLTFVSTSGTITRTVADGTLQLLVRWTDINANGGWAQKQTITVRSSVAFPSTTWSSAAAGPVATTGVATFGYNNVRCTTP